MKITPLFNGNILPNHYCECDYLTKILDTLKLSLSDNYNVIVKTNDYYENLTPPPIFKNILIHVGNEVPYDNKDYDKFDLVFRFYHSNKCDNKKVFNINIGYNSSGYNQINFKSNKPLNDRKYNISFNGQIGNRFDLKMATDKLTIRNTNINFTNGFRQGLGFNDYLDILGETKICLVPRGVSNETFRFNEALASGCIVITTEMDHPFYKDAPIVKIPNWYYLTDDLIKKTLSEDLIEYKNKNLKYYDEKLSPKATSDYILDVINNEK